MNVQLGIVSIRCACKFQEVVMDHWTMHAHIVYIQIIVCINANILHCLVCECISWETHHVSYVNLIYPTWIRSHTVTAQVKCQKLSFVWGTYKRRRSILAIWLCVSKCKTWKTLRITLQSFDCRVEEKEGWSE